MPIRQMGDEEGAEEEAAIGRVSRSPQAAATPSAQSGGTEPAGDNAGPTPGQRTVRLSNASSLPFHASQGAQTVRVSNASTRAGVNMSQGGLTTRVSNASTVLRLDDGGDTTDDDGATQMVPPTQPMSVGTVSATGSQARRLPHPPVGAGRSSAQQFAALRPVLTPRVTTIRALLIQAPQDATVPVPVHWAAGEGGQGAPGHFGSPVSMNASPGALAASPGQEQQLDEPAPAAEGAHLLCTCLVNPVWCVFGCACTACRGGGEPRRAF